MLKITISFDFIANLLQILGNSFCLMNVPFLTEQQVNESNYDKKQNKSLVAMIF